jgi:hypothetical protein
VHAKNVRKPTGANPISRKSQLGESYATWGNSTTQEQQQQQQQHLCQSVREFDVRISQGGQMTEHCIHRNFDPKKQTLTQPAHILSALVIDRKRLQAKTLSAKYSAKSNIRQVQPKTKKKSYVVAFHFQALFFEKLGKLLVYTELSMFYGLYFPVAHKS